MIRFNSSENLRQFKTADTLLDLLNNMSINQNSRNDRQTVRQESVRERRRDFVNNLRFRQSDGWSDSSVNMDEVSDDETDMTLWTQTDVIKYLMTCNPLHIIESHMKNAIISISHLIQTIENDFDDSTQVDNAFFCTQLLNSISTLIGSDISVRLQAKILGVMRELFTYSYLDESMTRNITNSNLISVLINTIECGDGVLVEKSIDFLQELMNFSKDLIFHIINSGYVNALKTRSVILRPKSISRLFVNRISKLGINDDRNAEHIKFMARTLSRAVFQLFNTEFNQSSNFIQCLIPLLIQFITFTDEVVKQNALSTFLLFDLNNSEIKNKMINNFVRILFELIFKSNDATVVLIIQLFTKLIEYDRNVFREKFFIIETFGYLRQLLSSTTSNQVIKAIVFCLTTTLESLPINSTFMSENMKEFTEMIVTIMKVKYQLKDKAYVIQKIVEKLTQNDLENILRSFDLMEIIEDILNSEDRNCLFIGLKIINRIFQVSLNNYEQNPWLLSFVSQLYSEKEFSYIFGKLVWHRNSQISTISQQFISTYIDQNSLFETEDKSIIPNRMSDQFIFGSDLFISHFSF